MSPDATFLIWAALGGFLVLLGYAITKDNHRR